MNTLTILIPMGGWATRMRPHTYSKPKPLISVAGKTSLEHLLDTFKSVPAPENAEYVFIVGPYLGEVQIPAFIKENYPNLKAHYLVQREMKGQSHALSLAREHLRGPMIVCFSDTLMETDFSFLAEEKADGVAWVMPVEDPRRFGVAELGEGGWVKRFIEKPTEMDNNLALVGCYYFKNGERLMSAIDKQIEENIQLKNEFFLADAITLMLNDGAKIRVEEINSWLDTGTIEATLDTNKALLERLHTGKRINRETSKQVVEPSFVHPTAEIINSVVGPFASIGANCRIENSRVEESVVEAGCEIKDAALSRSLIGRQAKVKGRGDGKFIQLNVGDNSSVILG